MAISESDIKNIYDKSGYSVENIKTNEPNNYTFDIHSKCNCITDIVWREYNDDKVYHKMLSIKEEYRKNGHCRNIHELEYYGYKKLGIKTIELDAARDGIIVWLKLGFNIIENSDKDTLLNALMRYLNSIVFPHSPKKVDNIIKKLKNDMTILESKDSNKYLMPKGGKISFTDYIYSSKNSIYTIKMMKKVL